MFRALVIAVACLYVAVEFVRLAFVLASLHRGALFGGAVGVEIGLSSFAAPLLYASSATRGELVQRVLSAHATPRDIIAWRFVHCVLLAKAPLLAVNVWYLLSVTQVGMGALNWLSLLTGALKVVQLSLQLHGAGNEQRKSYLCVALEELSVPATARLLRHPASLAPQPVPLPVPPNDSS